MKGSVFLVLQFWFSFNIIPSLPLALLFFLTLLLLVFSHVSAWWLQPFSLGSGFHEGQWRHHPSPPNIQCQNQFKLNADSNRCQTRYMSPHKNPLHAHQVSARWHQPFSLGSGFREGQWRRRPPPPNVKHQSQFKMNADSDHCQTW